MRKWLSIIILIVIQTCTKYIKTIRIRRNNIIAINQRNGNIIEKRYYPKYFINNPLGIKNKRKKKLHDFKLYRGCGTTCSYEWVENDDNIEIKIRLSPNVCSSDIQYRLTDDYINAKIKDKPKSLIEGKLKGFVDVNYSTWFLEKYQNYSILNIFLKKKYKGINEWVGVVEKENILHISYDNLSSKQNNLDSNNYASTEPNELLYSQTFEGAKIDDIYNFLINWVNKKSNNQNEFGIPVLKLKTTVNTNDYDIEILISGYDIKWLAQDSLLLKLCSGKNGTELFIHRGKIATGISGQFGNMISHLIKDCEEKIIKKLQHDIKGVFYLNPTSKKINQLMHEHSPQNSYDYVVGDTGERKHISTSEETSTKKCDDHDHNNMNELEKNDNYDYTHNKEIRKDSPEEELIVKELNLNSKVKLSCDDKSKEPEFMKDWPEEKKIEFRRNSILELKKNLEISQENKLTLKLEDYINYMKTSFDLTEDESKLIWQKGSRKSDEQKNRDKYYRFIEIENLTDKISMYNNENIDSFSNSYMPVDEPKGMHTLDDPTFADNSNENSDKGKEVRENYMDLTPSVERNEIDSDTKIKQNENQTDENINKRFYNCLEEELLDSGDKSKVTIYDMYINSDDKGKKAMREKWKKNELRLNTLIEELKYADEEMVSVICNNYRDVLLSDEYACLMKIRLEENPPHDLEDKRILQIINSFVMSLYDDIKIVMEHEEKEHLKKIHLICEKAIHDEKGLNDFIESMKPLLDYSFLGYIKHAIQVEKKNIKAQNLDFREHPSDWLIILMIIQKGIYSILEKDIWQDVINISAIIGHEQPSVRKTILTTMVASMPKADWIFFKDIIKTLFKSVQEKKLTANHFPNFPHIIEAIFQLNYDIEQILPDWFIKEMLDEYDKSVVELMISKKPLFWKMKETKWDKDFVQNFKKMQIQKYKEYESHRI
ncbi:CS domain protein, putative [Plasmodium chabaudi chabaudi]|uniref:NudC domain-containing protein 1 n=1 Tax=Plasmodium chabaudi chabaudi TaxID=31271 RepID=A0A1D3RTY0_PLACU|nr:CS domain protein, putative [Plasmodium chabaudi chabaudi]